MTRTKQIFGWAILLVITCAGCNNKHAATGPFHFTQVTAAQSGIAFRNTITETDSVNVFTNEYMYNGSGVGVGDFNHDGLKDVFFCGSMESSRLYLNKGDFKFDDITEASGVATSSWCTGVTVADVNADGFEDIYVCTSHSTNAEKRKNLLFINDGKLHFSEQAAAYGLADTGYATQAAFADFDKDGDLDMYLLNHRLYSHTANNLQPKDTSGHSPAADKLFRNNGIAAGQSHPTFTDVSLEAGVKEDGYGLGLVITDVNNDNWPDIYVANDYIGNDLLWLNNQQGGFTNVIATALRHQSYNSMGVDAADINNDGLPDLAVVDMLPETNERKKMMFSAASQEKYDMQQRYGYEPSFMRNMLQLNNGVRTVGKSVEPFYSEVGQMAGVFETDWSWSVLMADFDNDGWKDMHITNGLGKDLTNNDYAAFRNGESNTGSYTFGTANAAAPDGQTVESLRKAIDQFGSIRMNNYLYQNNQGNGFADRSGEAGIDLPSISNGAAYADLDNDGDLDLVVNNINEPAFVWKNELRRAPADSLHNFLTVSLKGTASNRDGLGAKVTLYMGSQLQFAEQSPVRGFSSSVDLDLHFGLANLSRIDSVKIQWPDDNVQVLRQVAANQHLIVDQVNALAVVQSHTNQPILFEPGSNNGILFKHSEAPYFDFGNHQQLAQRYSQLGSCIATGDLNGDGLEDFFVGGAANQSGKIFLQQGNGSFAASSLVSGTKAGEDLGAVFFDVDADKDLDLVVTGGSFEFTVAAYNQPQLYLNDGKGHFSSTAGTLPVINDITDAVTVADYDLDGDLDLFIGGRLAPGKYPQSPRSYLLQNNNGKFTDVTNAVGAALSLPGMITAALFTDFNNDQQPDLVICGEWTAVRFFQNNKGRFTDVTETTGLNHMNGLWRTLQQSDIDYDGDLDYIVGNMGLNNRYHIKADQPMCLYAKDIDKNGFDELIPAYYIKDNSAQYQLFPGIDRNQLAEQLPIAKKKYLLHADYARVSMQSLQQDFGKDGWTVLKCEQSASVWLENNGAGKFSVHVLPLAAQVAPVNSIVAADVDGDGSTDLVLAGNEYQSSIAIGRYDASYGLLLKGNGKGAFTPVAPASSGFIIDGDVKDMKVIRLQNQQRVLLAMPNDSELKYFNIIHPGKKAA